MRAGRSLDALLSAYRIGARLAWERFLAAGEAAGHEPRTLYRLASAIFDYIDGISAESVEGFTEERAAAEGERQRRRRALARLLARDDVAPEEVRDLARLAAWARPAALAALVVGDGTGDEPDADRLASRLGEGAIAAAEGALAIAWVPDPEAPGRRAQLESALDGVPAALGPTVVPERAPLSLARARAAHALVLDGRVGDGAARGRRRAPARPAAARRRRSARDRPRRPRARAARRPAPRRARAPAHDAARVARPPRAGHPRGRRAARPPADRALPRRPAARALRRAPRGRRRALRARARAAGGAAGVR